MSSEPAQQGAQKSSNESILAFWSGLAVPSFYSVPSTVLQSWCSPWSPEGEKGLRGLSAFPRRTLDSEPARVAPCLLCRLLSGRVCILLCRRVSSTLHRREAPHTGPTRPVWFHFGVSS